MRQIYLALLLLLPGVSMAQEPGDLDASFGIGGKVLTDFEGFNDEAQASVLQTDGKIVVGGTVVLASGLSGFGLARYLPDGTLDSTFDGDGRVTTPFEPYAVGRAMLLQPDGKIVMAGYTGEGGGTSVLVRYLPGGALDTTFGDNGKVLTPEHGQVNEVLLQPDGKIVAAGSAGVARYLADGTLDATFDDDGFVASELAATSAGLQADGKIVTAGGAFNQSTGQFEFALARYQPDGSLDTTFGIDGRVITDAGGNGSVRAITLQPDGKIVAAGHVFPIAGSHVVFALVRYLSDGTLDTTFGGDGRAAADFGVESQALAVKLEPDGKIVEGGNAGSFFGLALYLPNGNLDSTFGADGLVTTDFGGTGPAFVTELLFQTDGRLVATGLVALDAGQGFAAAASTGFDFALARYETGLATQVGPPTSKEQCKHGGWRAFNVPRVFKNQGDCIQFVNTGH